MFFLVHHVFVVLLHEVRLYFLPLLGTKSDWKRWWLGQRHAVELIIIGTALVETGLNWLLGVVRVKVVTSGRSIIWVVRISARVHFKKI